MASKSVATTADPETGLVNKNEFEALSNLDLMNEMGRLTMQVEALLFNTFGGSGEGFRGMAESKQDTYLFAVHDLHARSCDVLDEMDTRLRAGARDAASKS